MHIVCHRHDDKAGRPASSMRDKGLLENTQVWLSISIRYHNMEVEHLIDMLCYSVIWLIEKL